MAGLKKLLRRHGKKHSASKEDVASTVDGGEEAFGYIITKEKDLPKLHKAVWNRDTTKVKQLCKKADINQFDKENRTALHLACACGNEEITQFLLTNKAKTNLCDNDGRTALMKAIECSHQGCIELLLKHNADVKVTDKNFSSPLHLAAANNLVDVATMLLNKGLDTDVSDKEGFTALHVASSLANQDFVLFLLNKGANINATDAHGRTPLMTAAAEGHLDIVKMLLQNNAEVSLKDGEGWKAADHAVMNGIHSCAKIIDEHEVRRSEPQEGEKTVKEVHKQNIKKPGINEVLKSSSPINGDTGFSFGAPAADKVGVDANLQSEGSTSRQSDGDDSWASSSGDENSEIDKKSSKISLVAALKKVERSASNISNKSQSRIPVRSQVKSPSLSDQVSSQDQMKSPQSPSKIPRPVSSTSPPNDTRPSSQVSLPQSPRDISAASKQNTLSPTASVKSVGSASAKSSPRVSFVGTSPQVRSPALSPSESVASGMDGRVNRRQSGGSLPLEYLKPTEENTDSDQGSKKKAAETQGYSPSFMSPRSDRSSRNLQDELGLGSSFSEGEDDDDLDSAMSGEVNLDNIEQELNKDGEKKNLTSTAKPKEATKENPGAYLGLDLNSSISSVSDPDTSGLSNHNEERRKEKSTNSVKDDHQIDAHKKDDLNEGIDSNWDSSEGFLPSDNEKIPGNYLEPKPRLANGKELSLNVSNKTSHDKELQSAVEKRRERLDNSRQLENHVKDNLKSGEGSFSDEDGSELSESESEWAKEREESRKKELERMKENAMNRMKVEENRKKEVEKKLEMEKQKEEARRLEWERQENEKEIELAESIKKELEEELGIDGEHEGSEEELGIDGEHDGSEEELGIGGEHEGSEEELGIDGERERSDEELGIDGEHDGSEEELGIDGEHEGSEEDEESYSEKESEVKSDHNARRQQEVRTLGDFEEHGSSKWDSTEDEGVNGDEVSYDEDLQDNEDSMGSEGTLEDERVNEAKFEKQLELKEKEKMKDLLNNNYNEPVLVEKEAYLHQTSAFNNSRSPRGDIQGQTGKGGSLGGTKGITEDARRLQKEEDELLEAYKARQEEMLEQERRMEEDLARRERERVEDLRMELEKEKGEERKKMAELEKQRKARELTLQKEKEAFEEEVRRKNEQERDIQEMNLKKKQDEEERKRMEAKKRNEEIEEKRKKDEENKARLQNMLRSSPERELPLLDQATVAPVDSEYISKTKAERFLSEKHRDFIDDAANSTALEIQKVQNRERLADKSREIRQRQFEAKADLDAVRIQTTKLGGPQTGSFPSKRESPPTGVRETMHVSVKADKIDTRLPSRQGVNSDWSTSSEDERESPLSRAKTPSADAGLGSSLSPGVQSLTRPSLFQSLPLMSSSPGVLEASPLVVQLKGSLRDSKRQLEKTQEKLILSETKVKQLANQADDLQSKLEEVIHQKSLIERELFEINEENRVLKHESARAMEDKNIAEVLVETVKDQLGRSEEKLTREIKLRRTVEESVKQLEMDRVNLENALRHLGQDHEDLKKALERGQEQSRLKDELYKEQKKQNDEIIMESQKVSQHRAEVLTKLESVDENRKTVEASSEYLRNELLHAKSEVGRLHSQLETLTKVSQNEVDLFKRQLADQTAKNRRLDDTLAKLRSEYDLQLSEFRSGNNEQQNKLEVEVTAKHRLQSEATVLRTKFENIENERNESNKTRTEAERQLHSLREELYKSKSTLEKELSSLRENNQLSTLKLNAADNKISSLEAELQTANIMLAERSSQMSINIRDIDNKRASVSKLEVELRTEKEANVRLSAKLENVLEKMRSVENESTSLRRHLEIASENVRKQEENSQETQNKLHSTITEIRTDYEKTKGKMSEKKKSLVDVVEKYKEEIQQNFTKLKLQDDNIRQLQQELAESTRKLSAAEASLGIQVKAREDLEQERDHLRQTLRSYEGQMTATISEKHVINGHASSLQNELEHSRKVSDETSQRLATTAYDLENLGKVKDEVGKVIDTVGLEDDVTHLKVDRVKLEATLNEEKAKTDILLREIRENNEGRTHLESLLSHIKSSNIDLEEKLQLESSYKTQHAREAEEAKGLWESEVRSRSKLGSKIIEMENKVNESKAAIDEEKKKTRKALDSRKVLQGKLDVHDKRSDQHQKEVHTLKTQIKAYKRRLKEFEITEKRIPTIQAEFNRETQQYETTITSLRNQLRDLNEKLRQENDLRVLVERRGQQHEKELSLTKAQAKEKSRQAQKLEKLNRQMEDELERTKEHYNDNFVAKAQLDAIKMDLEAKSRIELNRKLADVNAHLEEQALARDTLDRSRNEQESLKFKEMDNTISRLKREVDQYRSNFHKVQTEKETVEVEAERFKDMFETETKRKEKLNDLLFKEREKAAESKAIFNLERSRSGKFRGNNGVSMPYLGRSPGVSKNESIENKSPGLIYSQPKDKLMESVDKELSKSIQRHLDTISSNGPAELWANQEINMTSSPLASSTSQYMDTLKRNYFV